MKKAHSQFNNLSKVNISGVSILAIGGIALFIKKKKIKNLNLIIVYNILIYIK